VRVNAAANRQKSKQQQTSPKLTAKTSPQLTSIQEKNPFKDIVFPSQPKTMSIPIVVSKSIGTESSDSDTDDLYLNVPSFTQVGRPKCQKSASFSNSSGSYSGPRRPVALPRTNVSQSSSFIVSKSLPKKEIFKPPLPPKPNNVPPIPQREKLPLKKYNSVGSSIDPQRPISRPRNSEIRRAQDKARKRPQTTNAAPALAVLDENGLETASMSSKKSSESVTSKISTKSAPGYTGSGKPNGGSEVEKIKKKRAQSTQSDISGKVSVKTKLQVPERPPRPRHKSEGEADLNPPPVPVKNPDSVHGMGDGTEALNKDVANTLLKFIIKSEDESLKNALRDLIKEDSGLVHSLNDI